MRFYNLIQPYLRFTDELSCRLKCVFRNLGASHEAGYFSYFGIFIQSLDMCKGRGFIGILEDPQIIFSCGSYLRQMGYAEDLVGAGDLLELASNDRGCDTGDTRVDLIEDQGRDGVIS